MKTVLGTTRYRLKVLDETLAFGFALKLFSEDVLRYWKKIAFSNMGLLIINNEVINVLDI